MQLSLMTLLTAIFVTLKLVGYIDWSWWWVLAPTWVPGLAGVLLILFVAAKSSE